jgi:ATP-dependent helicase/DNAse subunit B
LQEIPGLNRKIEARDFGNIIHKALQELFSIRKSINITQKPNLYSIIEQKLKEITYQTNIINLWKTKINRIEEFYNMELLNNIDNNIQTIELEHIISYTIPIKCISNSKLNISDDKNNDNTFHVERMNNLPKHSSNNLNTVDSINIIAIFDRIDHDTISKTLLIIDYKTGVLPIKNEIITGTKSQMLIQYYIIRKYFHTTYHNYIPIYHEIKGMMNKIVEKKQLVELLGNNINFNEDKFLMSIEENLHRLFAKFLCNDSITFICYSNENGNEESILSRHSLNYFFRTEEWL